MRIKIPKESIFDCNLPCILHWNQDHYVVLYQIDAKWNTFKICFPCKGLMSVKETDFNAV